jgi:hypothetical protein
MIDRITALIANADAELEVEDLLKLVLALLAVLLALEVLGRLFAFAAGLLKPLLMLVVIGLIALWLLDRL